MKKAIIALALALAISPFTFAQTIERPTTANKSTDKHKKPKKPKKPSTHHGLF
jgi:hypothetical protein